ncbi:MAG: hypothetical protein EBZ47_08055 [Chlamydiae bacterium]|nr:hypothetical protein [Chlamydiota bacterium]
MEGEQDEIVQQGSAVEKKRVKAADREQRKFRFSSKLKYKKPSSLRRKLKKRIKKYKSYILLFTIGVIITCFLFLAVDLAIKQNQENIDLQKQKRIQRILEQEERNKKF